jgi:predicted ATPase
MDANAVIKLGRAIEAIGLNMRERDISMAKADKLSLVREEERDVRAIRRHRRIANECSRRIDELRAGNPDLKGML